MYDTFEDDDFSYAERLNKSQQKREIQALMALGKALAKLDIVALEKMSLPDELRQALVDVRAMRHGAEKRQFKLICKMLRRIDTSSIEETIAQLAEKKAHQDRAFHRTERWRDRLLHEGDAAVTELMAEFPQADVHQIRQLIRNAHREAKQHKPPKSSRALFRLLRAVIAEERD